MKIALTSTGTTLDSALEPRFGRAAVLIVYDTDSGEFTALDNSANAALGQGAGIQTAQAAASAGAGRVVSGRVGPKATLALNQAGIGILTVPGGSVREALERARTMPDLAATPEAPVMGPGMGLGRGMGRGMNQGQGQGMGPCGAGQAYGRGGAGRGCGRGMGQGRGMGRRGGF